MSIDISPEARTQAIASLRQYFSKELDQEIGDLKASVFLDFLLTEIAPSIHNAAIEKAQLYLRDRLVDLEALSAEPEFTYWEQSRGAVRPGKKKP
jgi:uncharacterized protein (DUF2164 family)